MITKNKGFTLIEILIVMTIIATIIPFIIMIYKSTNTKHSIKITKTAVIKPSNPSPDYAPETSCINGKMYVKIGNTHYVYGTFDEWDDFQHIKCEVKNE